MILQPDGNNTPPALTSCTPQATWFRNTYTKLKETEGQVNPYQLNAAPES